MKKMNFKNLVCLLTLLGCWLPGSFAIGAGQSSLEPAENRGAIAQNRSVLNLQSGNQLVSVDNETIMFYDDGGVDGNYSNSFDGIVVLSPVTAGEYVKIIFDSFQLDTYGMHELSIYNGSEVDDEHLIGSWEKDENPGVVKSTSIDGKLCVKFHSGSYGTPNAGWSAQIMTFIPVSITYNDGEAFQASTESTYRNNSNVELLKVKLDFAGELPSSHITSLKFGTDGTTNVSDIARAKVMFSDITGDISAAELFGSVVENPNGEFVVNGDVAIDSENSYYFWLCYDVASTATIGNSLDAVFSSVTVDGAEHQIVQGNPEGNRSIVEGFHGEYTLGTDENCDYQSFEQAINALSEKGIDGPVKISVKSGTYTDHIKLPHFTGTSEATQIVFSSESGLASDVIIQPTYSGMNKGVVHFDGSDFITFEKMTIKTDKTTYDGVLYVSGVSRNITIKGCVVEAPMSIDYSKDICLLKMKSENNANMNNDRISLINNTFKGGYIAAYIGGTGYLALPKETGARIIGNTFVNQGSKSIFIADEEDMVIADNSISNDQTTKSGFQAIDAFRMIGASKIYNNKISLDLNVNCIGVEFRPAKGSSTDAVMVYNNMVNVRSTVSSNGLLLDDGCSNVGFYYNTFCTGGLATGSTVVSVLGKSSEIPANVILKNNMLVNETEGKVFFIRRNSYGSGLTFDHNLVYTQGSVMATIEDEEVADFAAWQALNGGANSISEQPEFISALDLHLVSAGDLAHAEAMNVISVDIDGDPRDEISPYIGADEYILQDEVAPEFAAGYPAVTNITWDGFTFESKLDESATLYYVILEKNATAPDAEQVKAGTDAAGIVLEAPFKASVAVAQDMVKQINIAGLNQHTEYKVYATAEDNAENLNNDVQYVELLTTWQPTTISSFESQEIGAVDVVDGSSSFQGFQVKNSGGGAAGTDNYVSAVSGSTQEVIFNNTEEGYACDGFWYYSSASAICKGKKADGTSTESILINASEGWAYFDARTMGEIVGYTFESVQGEFYLDQVHDLPAALTIDFMPDFIIAEGEQAQLNAVVTGGFRPYTFLWTPDESLNNGSISNPEATPDNTTIYQVTVHDDKDSVCIAMVTVNVTKEAGIATFDDLSLEANSFWNGPQGSNGVTAGFMDNGFHFNNMKYETYNYWGGFGYSNMTDITVPGGLNNQFTSAAGQGAEDSENYGVAYVMGAEARITVTSNPDGVQISGMYITNNTWAVTSMENGDATAKKFGGDSGNDQDWFMLTAEGFDKTGVSTGATTFYLADYRFANNEEDYIVKTWHWFDLSGLGLVKSVKFTLSSSDSGAMGMNTPAYFCVDNFNGLDPDDAAPIVANPIADQVIDQVDLIKISLKEVFSDPDNNNDLIVVTVSGNTNTELLETEIFNDTLFVKRLGDNGHGEITLKAVSNRRSVEDLFMVDVVTGIAQHSLDQVMVYPNPCNDVVMVKLVEETALVQCEVLNTCGQILKNVQLIDNQIDLADLPRGIYLILIRTENRSTVKRIVKK